ncbi:MAG: hypothetical protein LBL92_05800 [Propionibacteriaceae bacterium]|jgi:hypothetical protein|nr:hypothetical protein [Propionibacteriaceae bacterium]
MSLGLVSLVGLAGCGAAEPPDTISFSPGQATSGLVGDCLPDLGFSVGPSAALCLPVGIELTDQYESDATVILIGRPDDATAVRDFLATALPAEGWEVTAESDEALIFTADRWTGSFVISPDSWALTVRAE